jgi:hypothetical protein
MGAGLFIRVQPRTQQAVNSAASLVVPARPRAATASCCTGWDGTMGPSEAMHRRRVDLTRLLASCCGVAGRRAQCGGGGTCAADKMRALVPARPPPPLPGHTATHGGCLLGAGGLAKQSTPDLKNPTRLSTHARSGRQQRTPAEMFRPSSYPSVCPSPDLVVSSDLRIYQHGCRLGRHCMYEQNPNLSSSSWYPGSLKNCWSPTRTRSQLQPLLFALTVYSAR